MKCTLAILVFVAILGMARSICENVGGTAYCNEQFELSGWSICWEKKGQCDRKCGVCYAGDDDPNCKDLKSKRFCERKRSREHCFKKGVIQKCVKTCRKCGPYPDPPT